MHRPWSSLILFERTAKLHGLMQVWPVEATSSAGKPNTAPVPPSSHVTNTHSVSAPSCEADVSCGLLLSR